MSHTLHYGTGVFEGIRARDSKIGTTIFRLSDHVDRLFDSAEAYNLKIPYEKEIITNVIKDSVHLNNLSSAYIRPLVFFGEGEMGLLPKSVPVYVSVAAWNWGAYLGDDAGNQGVSIYKKREFRSTKPQIQKGETLYEPSLKKMKMDMMMQLCLATMT